MACSACEERRKKMIAYAENAKAKLKLRIAKLVSATTRAEQQTNRAKQPSDSD